MRGWEGLDVPVVQLNHDVSPLDADDLAILPGRGHHKVTDLDDFISLTFGLLEEVRPPLGKLKGSGQGGLGLNYLGTRTRGVNGMNRPAPGTFPDLKPPGLQGPHPVGELPSNLLRPHRPWLRRGKRFLTLDRFKFLGDRSFGRRLYVTYLTRVCRVCWLTEG